MSPLDVCGQRLVNQHLSKQRLERASDVVRLFGAVQAQEYSAAKWGIAQRTREATDAAVEKEMTDGAILRTHILRPTWHFVAPQDIRWMQALTAPRVRAILASYDRKLELDKEVLRRSRSVLTKALRDGKQLTRSELRDQLTKGRIRADGTQRLAHLMMHAELDGLICSGGRRGKQFTYSLLEERVPPAKDLQRDEALSELIFRFFTTRGPATIHDFAWWSGLTKADATRGLQATANKLQSTIIGERTYFHPPATRVAKGKPALARLLPSYDEYFIGLKDRTAMLSKLGAAGGTSASILPFRHVVAIDGHIVAGWDWRPKGNSVAVEVKAFAPLAKGDRLGIAGEVDRFSEFLRVPVSLEFML